MNAGDKLVIDIHDSTAGLVTVIHDRTTGQMGSMTASEANGFAQINFDPGAGTCTQSPYGFHPMYSTSSEHTRVPWAAHSYNVAASDEIGHFQYCSTIPVEGGDCCDPTADADDSTCFSAAFSLLVQVGGCIASNTGFDGTSYLPDWPGTGPNHGQDTKYHADPIMFTSPVFNGSQNYSRVAFEADMPRIEAADFGGNLQPVDGRELHQPAAGRAVLSDLHDRKARPRLHLAVGRYVSPGHAEHVRGQLDGRVRAAPAERLPGRRVRASVPVQQLPADLEQQPLPA